MTMHYGPIEEAAVVCPCLGLQFSAPVIDLYRFVYLVVRFKSALEQLHHYPTLLLMVKSPSLLSLEASIDPPRG